MMTVVIFQVFFSVKILLEVVHAHYPVLLLEEAAILHLLVCGFNPLMHP